MIGHLAISRVLIFGSAIHKSNHDVILRAGSRLRENDGEELYEFLAIF